MPEKALGERCTMNAACGRKGMCIFDTTLNNYGQCVQILSQSDSTVVLPMFKNEMADLDTGIYVYQTDFEKTCLSGYLNVTTGRCDEGLQSINKVLMRSLLFIGLNLHSRF